MRRSIPRADSFSDRKREFVSTRVAPSSSEPTAMI